MAENKEESDTIDFSGNKLIWIIGAIILLIAGYFGLRAIFASMENYRLTLVDAPKEVNAASVATFTWRVDGPATTINHTAVHLGTTSQPGDLASDVKPENTPYKLMVQDFANGNFDIPLQFIGNIAMDTAGTYYYRVHANIKGKEYWSEEYSLEVKVQEPKVTLMNAPTEVEEDTTFAFTWRVDGPPATINHTSIHYGTVSNPGVLGTDVAPDDTKYADLIKDFASGTYNIPLQFVGNTTIARPGTYYYRGHAIIGGLHYWTDEATLTVSTKSAGIKPSPTLAPEDEEEEEPGLTVTVSPTP